MSTINDGGPAFPGMHRDPSKEPQYASIVGYHGMTLRDYFAAKAMQGLLAQSLGCATGSDPVHGARYAYAMADAMLKARKEGGAS